MNEAALLLPGQLTRSVAEKLDREHLKRKEKQGSTVYKKKRNELKKKRKQRERGSHTSRSQTLINLKLQVLQVYPRQMNWTFQ